MCIPPWRRAAKIGLTIARLVFRRPNGRALYALEIEADHRRLFYSGELRAQGIRHATGDFVMLLDGDRPFDLGLLEFLMRSATRADTTEREARA